MLVRKWLMAERRLASVNAQVVFPPPERGSVRVAGRLLKEGGRASLPACTSDVRRQRQGRRPPSILPLAGEEERGCAR